MATPEQVTSAVAVGGPTHAFAPTARARRAATGTIMRSREGGMQRGDRPGEGDAELLELPDVNTCRLVQSGLVSCVNTSTQHFNPATAVCMQRAHWVARAACVVGADTAHTESFRLCGETTELPLSSDLE